MARPTTLGIIAKIIIDFDVMIVSALQKGQHSIHTDSRDRVSSDRQDREKVSKLESLAERYHMLEASKDIERLQQSQTDINREIILEKSATKGKGTEASCLHFTSTVIKSG